MIGMRVNLAATSGMEMSENSWYNSVSANSRDDSSIKEIIAGAWPILMFNETNIMKA